MNNKQKTFNKVIIRKTYILLAVLGLLVGIGSSIIFEGVALLFATPITTGEQLKVFSTNQVKYATITAQSISYTDIDFLVESTRNETRYKGYLAQKDDEYFLVFRHSFIDEKRPMILTNAWFDDANMILFRESVINVIVETTDNQRADVESRIYPTVFVDVSGRIINDLPVVILWLLLVGALLVGLMKQLLSYKQSYFLSSTKQLKQWTNDTSETIYQDKKMTLSQKSVTFHRFTFKHIAFNQAREIHHDQQSITLFLDNQKCTIQASEKIISEILAGIQSHLLYETN